jgi:hypothetical protein
VVTDVFGIRASDIVLKTSAGLWVETIEHGLTQAILWFRFTFGGQKNEELFGRPNVPLVRRSFGKSRSKNSAARQCAMPKQLNYQSDGTSGREPVDTLTAVDGALQRFTRASSSALHCGGACNIPVGGQGQLKYRPSGIVLGN